jgi:hypothetical protein
VKASKAFIWPRDGKRDGTWGRVKELLSNRGPDMYVAFSAHKNDYMSNRPSRARWSGHTNLDDTGPDNSLNSAKFAPWINSGMLGGRNPGLSYDFRTQKYCTPYRKMWTDAVWQPEGTRHKRNNYPEAIRNIYGEWYEDDRYLPQVLGGPASNERGRGYWGFHRGKSPHEMRPLF